MNNYKEKKINFLIGVSDYFEKKTRRDGSVFCKKDRVEHTGKNTYSVIIDCVLYQKTGDEKYFDRALKRALRAINNLTHQDGLYIFYPGSMNPRNASNSIIDGGAIVDSLVFFLEIFSDRVSDRDREKIKDAIFKHSDTYLKKYCVDKKITNQRLWGATGLASAYHLFSPLDKGELEGVDIGGWRDAVLKSIEISLSEQNDDGSFPYHPNYKEIGGHPGMADISPYYHSRHIAFILHSLEKIDEPIDEYLDKLRRATDFLLAMYHMDGKKEMKLEGKHWYWGSEYEVASNSYDIYVFTKMYEITGDENYFIYADRAFRKLLEHTESDGGINSNKGGGDNWQCRVVWNSHVAWFAKVIDLVLPNLENKSVEFFKNFYDAGVIKFENRNYSFILRYKKKPRNIDWGGAMAGGELLYYSHSSSLRGANTRRTQGVPPQWGSFGFGAWQSIIISLHSDEGRLGGVDIIKNGKNPLKDFIVDNKQALLGERWRGFIYVTSGNIFGAIRRFYNRVIKQYPGYSNEYSNIWATDSELVECNKDKIKIKAPYARRDGKVLDGKYVIKEYIVGEGELEIKES